MIPPNFRLATGVSKFTGESKPDTWLEDYRVAVQIGGGNDEVAMKHLPLMLEGSARAWLNQLAPSSIYTWRDLPKCKCCWVLTGSATLWPGPLTSEEDAS